MYIILPLIIISSIIQTYILMRDSLKHLSYGQIQKDQLTIVFVDYIPFIILIYLYIKTPFIDDTFFIRSELKRIFLCKLLSLQVTGRAYARHGF